MDIAFVVQEHPDLSLAESSPWVCFAAKLAKAGIFVSRFSSIDEAWRHFDAMILMVWLDWGNREYFKPECIIPVMEKYSSYRAAFPTTIQIVLNHVDMCRRAYATPYWRSGDPVLFRTPAYVRSELAPFPPEDIFAFEYVRGSACFANHSMRHAAGFIGSPSGPAGYRASVARETAKVGVGKCLNDKIPKAEYNALMGSCRIIVCPQGWGEQSYRHWDAWRSGKPILTDRACDSVEMIPGIRLRQGEHYLVYDHPSDIPDIVSDWTQRGRLADLEEIARNGQAAALNYDPFTSILHVFRSLQERYTSATR
jgi:hypothetical protein